MGTIQYTDQRITVEDRMLAHLQIVIVQKLRRDEPFLMSWVHSVAAGSGRAAIWVHPAFPLMFDFDGSRPPSINREWLQVLQRSADSSTGLILTTEDGQVARIGPTLPVARNGAGRARVA